MQEEPKSNPAKVPIDEEVYAVRLFISQVKAGAFKFVSPDPEDLDFDAQELFMKRTSWFYHNADKWTHLLQSSPDSEEFRQLTQLFHRSILLWLSKRLVDGVSTLNPIMQELERVKEENRRLKRENEVLKNENIDLVEELKKYRRPPIEKQTDDITGEE